MENTETKITNNEIDDALSLIDDAENKQIIEADDKKEIQKLNKNFRKKSTSYSKRCFFNV